MAVASKSGAKLAVSDQSMEEDTAIASEKPSSSSLHLREVAELYSSEEEGDEDNVDSSPSNSSSSSEEDEDGEGDDDMKNQVKEFFAELRLEEGKQKRRMMTEGIRIPRRKSLLPSHLHSVMGNANLRLARGDTGAAIELCMEVIRQGKHTASQL